MPVNLRLSSDIISICIEIIQKPRRPSASPSALSALKKYDSNANGFDITPDQTEYQNQQPSDDAELNIQTGKGTQR